MGGCVLSTDMTVHTLLCCRHSRWCRQQSLHVRLLYLCYEGTNYKNTPHLCGCLGEGRAAAAVFLTRDVTKVCFSYFTSM
jgi:hypothetical protein